MFLTATAVLRIGAILARRTTFAELNVHPPGDQKNEGVLHPGMFDLRQAQELALRSMDAFEIDTEMDRLCTRARCVIEALTERRHPLSPGFRGSESVDVLVRLMNHRPLYLHTPSYHDKDEHKKHILLWPRAHVAPPKRPVGVFLHLFYHDLASFFKTRLSALEAPYNLYISTDTDAKAAEIASVFPEATIRIITNQGRDVYPKLFGFADVYADHDLVLHLHGKKSVHAEKLDGWLSYLLDNLLPNPPEVNRILSFFSDVPTLGMVTPPPYKRVIGATHWGDNIELAKEIMARANAPIPNNQDIRHGFPVGGMFWARTLAIQPLIDLGLKAEHFPPEAGQVDATAAHAIERLFGVVCRRSGYEVLSAASAAGGQFRAFQTKLKSNREVRDFLARNQ